MYKKDQSQTNLLQSSKFKNKSIENLKSSDLFNANIEFPTSKSIFRPQTARSKVHLFTHTLQLPKTLSIRKSPTTPTTPVTPLYKKTNIIFDILNDNVDPIYERVVRHAGDTTEETINILFGAFEFFVLNGCELKGKDGDYQYTNILYKKSHMAQTKIKMSCNMIVNYNTVLNDIYTIINTDLEMYTNDQIKKEQMIVEEIIHYLKEKIFNFFNDNKQYKISTIIQSLQHLQRIDENGHMETLIMDGWINLLNSLQKKLQNGGKVVQKKNRSVQKKKRSVQKKKRSVQKKKRSVQKKKRSLQKKKRSVQKNKL